MSSVPPENRCTTFLRFATSDTASATPEDHGPIMKRAPSPSIASSARRVEVPACVAPSRVMYLMGWPRIFMPRSSSAMRMPRSLSGPTSANAPVWSHRPSITTSFGCARTIAGKPSVAAAAPIFRISLRFMGLLPREGASLLQTLRRRSNCSEWTPTPGQRENSSMHAAAAMLADPSRAAMVLALMDGRSRSAKKLALDAGVTAQTASVHLRKLVGAKMLVWQGRGRFKYFSLAGSEVAQAVEALSGIDSDRALPAAARDLRFARCCYDHLAGQLGVALTERLLRPANTVIPDLGIDLAALETSRRPLFRCCTDWTERRPHVAGALGAALLRRYMDERWLVAVENSRKLLLTPASESAFSRFFGLPAAFLNSGPGS